MTVFFRLLEAGDKARALRDAVAALPNANAFTTSAKALAMIPGTPFCYWASLRARGAFASFPPFANGRRNAVGGLKSGQDIRFIRLWWEPAGSHRWRPFAKGGSYSPHYADIYLVLDWYRDGRQSQAFYEKHRDVLGGIIRNPEYYFRPGLTWPSRTNGLSFRVLPRGCIFGHKGPAAFVVDDATPSLLALCAVLNSAPFGYLVSLQLARTELAQSFEVGLIQKTPMPNLDEGSTKTLASLSKRAWSLKRMLDTTNEVSHAFVLPDQLLTRRLPRYFAPVTSDAEFSVILREIDDLAFRLYGLDREDQATVEAWRVRHGSTTGAQNIAADNLRAHNRSNDDDDEEGANVDDTHALVSWTVGVAFGRFDIRLATGERNLPPEPEPFDPVLTHSPGMLIEPYSTWCIGALTAPPPILVDDVGHTNDITAAAICVFDRVEQSRPDNLQRTLAHDFFPRHVQQYSKSRRKAPVYWQLATPSVSYSAWLYLHAFTKDTLYMLQNDYVSPKLRHEEGKLEALQKEFGSNATASQRKEIAAQESFVTELRAFLEEVKRVAPLWNPDLDDGVIINFAPLWRLVPQHRAWQKECKETWDALCAEEYEWAHLAMHLWPERVVPKCATDRSLAIAHDLEDVFWVEDAAGKWKPRPSPTKSIEELVRERTSPAVKAALTSLLEAPSPGAGGKKGSRAKGRVSARANGEGDA